MNNIVLFEFLFEAMLQYLMKYFELTYMVCMCKKRVALLEGRIFASQSELFGSASDWLGNSWTSKKSFLFRTCKPGINSF